VKKSSTMKTALVAVGGGLAAMPAVALELGDVKVHSTIGQPLRASIAYALGPNEALSDTCVTLQPNVAANSLPSLNRASLIVTDGVIAITGSSVAREPLMTMRISIRCPYTAQLTREYMMFIDPAGLEPIAAPVAAAVAAKPRIAAPVAVRNPAPARHRAVSAAPIASATRHQVQIGETLSEIAQRIENRPVGLWDAVNTIFAANPDAFIDNDPNKLKAGSWLSIPSFGADAPVTVAAVPAPASAAARPAANSAPYEPAAFEPSGAVDDLAADVTEPVEQPAAAEPDAGLADLKPGDVILDGDNSFVVPVGTTSDETVVIPDTLLEGPAATSSSPNVPIARIQPVGPAEPETTNWLAWLAGGGIAIIVVLLLFGRRFRDQFGSAPIAPAVPQRRKSDTQEVEAISDVDLEISDDSPTAENLALDADLIVGTGLQDGTDMDVAQDFGFAATTDLDLELPEEMSSGAYVPPTDMLPAMRTAEESILESEVLPEDDDYDMSVMVDATKMPHPDDVTEKDLEAIQVVSDDETLITDDYTVSQEVDYKIIEQDYEDEMTATQALNLEIQKAAEDLAVRMDESDTDNTAEKPLATVHELEVTAQMPAKDENDDEIGDLDDTGVNPTVQLEAEDKTVEMTQESTVEMPKDGSKTG